MNATELANVLSGIFAELPKSYDEVRYALEGDAKFKPPTAVVRKVLTDFARETGKGSSSYAIQKAFDEDAGFVVDLAVTCAASYAKSTLDVPTAFLAAHVVETILLSGRTGQTISF